MAYNMITYMTGLLWSAYPHYKYEGMTEKQEGLSSHSPPSGTLIADKGKTPYLQEKASMESFLGGMEGKCLHNTDILLSNR